jgi:hypothetical protein
MRKSVTLQNDSSRNFDPQKRIENTISTCITFAYPWIGCPICNVVILQNTKLLVFLDKRIDGRIRFANIKIETSKIYGHFVLVCEYSSKTNCKTLTSSQTIIWFQPEADWSLWPGADWPYNEGKIPRGPSRLWAPKAIGGPSASWPFFF